MDNQIGNVCHHCKCKQFLFVDLQGSKQLGVHFSTRFPFFSPKKHTPTPKQDPCTDSGPNGAWPGDDKLSYCTPQGM